MAGNSPITFFRDLVEITGAELDMVNDFAYVNRPAEVSRNNRDNIIPLNQFISSVEESAVVPFLERLFRQFKLSNFAYVQVGTSSLATTRIEARGDIVCLTDTSETTSSLFRSTDRGWTWFAQTTPTERIQDIEPGAGQVWVFVSNASPYAYRSTNDAISWTAVSGMPVGEYRSISNDGGNNWCACGISGAKLANSTDDGISFTARTEPDSNTTFGDIQHSRNSGDNVWIAVGSNSVNDNAFARSTDNGTTWSAIAVPTGLGSNTWVSVDTDGEGNWMAVAASGTASERVVRSTDNGLTWSILTLPTEFQGIHFKVKYDDNTWIITTFDKVKIIYSLDNGINWEASTFRRYNDPAYTLPIIGITYTEGAWLFLASIFFIDPSDDANPTKILRSLEFQEGIF